MRDRNGPVRKISVAAPVIGETEKRYVADCLDSSWISSIGKYLSRFEQAFAEFCEVKHAITTNNGTTAIHLALVSLGIGPGDEVIVPTLTFVATANAVRYCGATPVLVDCDEETLNIDVRAIESKITARTRAIIPVHLYGHSADMDPILELAKKYNFHVIEDAAEAHGAKYRGRTVGSIGTCASFSFYGNKIVTTGEGGMVTTADPRLAQRLLRVALPEGMLGQQAVRDERVPSADRPERLDPGAPLLHCRVAARDVDEQGHRGQVGLGRRGDPDREAVGDLLRMIPLAVCEVALEVQML